MSLEDSVNNLRRLTQELAEEIRYEEYGQAFKFMRLIFDNIESYITIMDSNCKILYINPSAIKSAKDLLNVDLHVGSNCKDIINIINPIHCKDCLARACINKRKVLNEIFGSIKTGKKYWRTCIPLAYNGISGVIEIWEKHNA